MTEPAGGGEARFKWDDIYQDLRARIKNPEHQDYLPPGLELPAVTALAAEYSGRVGKKVGTATVEKALRALAAEGLIAMPGRGYRWTVRAIQRFLVDITGFDPRRWQESVQAGGYSPSSRWLQMRTIFPLQQMTALLGISPVDVLFARSTLYLADSRPVFLIEACYPENVAMHTALLQPREIHGDELAAIGRRENVLLDRIVIRGPTESETRQLGLMGLGSPVYEWTRYAFERDPGTGGLTWLRAVVTTLRGDACELQASPPGGADVLAELRASGVRI